MAVILYFPEMLRKFAEAENIKVPDDTKDFEQENFAHWAVFLHVSLGRAYDVSQHQLNASIISKLDEKEIKEVTIENLINLGCDFTESNVVD